MSERSDYISGLHALADSLDADPGLRLPYGATDHLSVFTHTAEENAAYVALLAGAAVEYLRDENSFPHRLTGTIGAALRLRPAGRRSRPRVRGPAARAGPGPVTPAPVDESCAGLRLVIVVLTLAAVALLLWALAERRRCSTEAERTHGWREAYAWLLATATCPLCGSRLEPGPVDPQPSHPTHEPHRGEL